MPIIPHFVFEQVLILSPVLNAYSLISCDADGDGLQHMVLCRVIMGRMEQVQPGSEHFHPSSEDFDSGVDDMQNPRLYVIFNAHMDTHIQAGYLVSFKLSPSQRGKSGVPKAVMTSSILLGHYKIHV